MKKEGEGVMGLERGGGGGGITFPHLKKKMKRIKDINKT